MDDIKQAINNLGLKMDDFGKIQAESNTKIEVLTAKVETLNERGTEKGETRAEDIYEKIGEVWKSLSYTKAALAIITLIFSSVMIKMGLK